MATSLIFSSPAGSTLLVAGRNQIGKFSVVNFSAVRVYAFLRPSTPKATVYLINPDLHDHVGTNPDAGALDSFALDAMQGKTGWYPVPGLNLSIEVFTTGPGGIDLFVYGQ
jgi:hypothetical protein